jgi:type VI secretion system secreted protein VgrG
MAQKFTQANRPLAVIVEGLKPDDLLLVDFTGEEAVSTLFRYRLHVLAENPAQVPFEKVLGKTVTVELELPNSKRPREQKRTFQGICQRVTQGETDDRFTHFWLDVVPAVWRLTKIARSRVFQHVAVPAILSELFKGVDPDGSSSVQDTLLPQEKQPRDYCVQYRESDFNFAARLMAEEGFQYYFRQASYADAGKDHPFHTILVKGDARSVVDWINEKEQNSEVPYNKAGGEPTDPLGLISSCQKVQELRAGKVTLHDHTFELPQSDLEAIRPTPSEVVVGKATHKLNGVNTGMELYDYPGQYAKRFDGIDRGGGEQPKEIGKVYDEAKRVAGLRMEQEATAAVLIHGESTCRQFTAGYLFRVAPAGKLEAQAQADGAYRLTSVRHEFGLPGGYTTGDNKGFYYHNTFTCAPAALPYRPPRSVPKPVIAGTQTAVVVGPKQGEVYTDKYGRVKVQFFWDRAGKKDLDSSCWVRVAQVWAGQGWGAHFWPRVGQEVVVAFEEGDPDQPIIVGSVYNAENTLPYDWPKNQTRSGIKTRSTPQGKPTNGNEIRFEDKKGAEELYVQAEQQLNVLVKGDENRRVCGDRHVQVDGKDGLDYVISKGSFVADVKKYVFISSEDGAILRSKNSAGLVYAKQALHVLSGEDSVVLGVGVQDGGTPPPTFIVVNTEPRISLALADGKVINMDADGIYLTSGGGVIQIDSAGNINIQGTSVNISGPSAAPAPFPECQGRWFGGDDWMRGGCTLNGELAPKEVQQAAEDQ